MTATPTKRNQMPRDVVDRLRTDWARELPDLDTSPMAVLGRAYRLSNLIFPSIAALFAAHGIDRGEFDVLATLRRAGPPFRLTPTELYTGLMIPSGSLTHRLGRLEKAGLVRRLPSKEDRRSLTVELTAPGRRTVETAFRADMAHERALLSGVDRKDLAAIEELLRRVTLVVERNLARRTE